MDMHSIAADSASLDKLKQAAGADPGKVVRQAANEFEALFARQLLKSMRDALPKTGLFDGPGKRMYEDMLDDQLARNMSGRTGGLGDMLARHLSQYMGEPGAPNKAGETVTPPTLSHGTAGAAQAPTTTAIPGTRVAIANLPAALSAALQGGARGANEPQAVALSRASPERQSAGLATSQSDFVNRLWPHAQRAETATGVPAAFVIGQAALESGWGRGEIRHPDGRSAHNLFGIKATDDWKGQTVAVTTTEYENGRKTQRVERFRAYPSYGDAFNDWIGLMTRLPRYAGVLSNASSPHQFAHGLQQAGYATDPQYGNKLNKVIEQTIAIQQGRRG